ncbi:MAG: hypothetical protein E7041_07715 [Lentisphaerae bacterium]|nr:hypothetical protein [Lentisphaerota bacterium]
MKLFTVFSSLLACAAVMAAEPSFRHDVTSEKKPWTHENFRNDPDEFSFAIIPDRAGSERRGIFPEAIKKANMLCPEFIMTVGDLIEGQMWKSRQDHEFMRGQWKELNSYTATSEAPFFHVVGNHDICRTRPGFPRANETTREVWEENCGTHTWYSFVYKNVLFICLNSMSGGDSRKPQIAITPEQLAWAKDVLKKNPDVRWTLIFMHHPGAWNQAAFLELEKDLIKRNYTVFAGDWHHYVKFRRHNRNYYVLATAGGCGSGPRGKDGRPMLKGMEYGEFDHIAYVTITKKGPVVANILLDGILPDDVMTYEKTKNTYGGDMNIPRSQKLAPITKTADGGWKMEVTELLLKKVVKKGVGTVENGVVRIVGNNERRNWARFDLNMPSPAGKKIRVTAEVRSNINKGKFQLAIRRIQGADKSLGYDGPYVTATQDWKKVSMVVPLDSKTDNLQCYLMALDMDDQSWAEVRNLVFEEVRSGAEVSVPQKTAAAVSAKIANGSWKLEVPEMLLKKVVKKGVGTVENGVARIVGNNERRNWARFDLNMPSPAGKKIRVTAEVKSNINKGKFQLAIRRIQGADKSLSYDGPYVTATQDWKKVSMVVPLDSKTDNLQCYLMALDMDDQSWAEVRNLVFEEVR